MSQLAIYGLALSYPDKLRVEVKPKSGRDRGKIALISGEKTAGGHNVVLIQWEQRRLSIWSVQLSGIIAHSFPPLIRDICSVDFPSNGCFTLNVLFN